MTNNADIVIADYIEQLEAKVESLERLNEVYKSSNENLNGMVDKLLAAADKQIENNEISKYSHGQVGRIAE